MPWWGGILILLGTLVLSVIFFCIFCTVSSSQSKSADFSKRIFRYIFYGIVLIISVYGIVSALHSCASEPYESGYADGYEAGIEEGINRVKDDPGAYLD